MCSLFSPQAIPPFEFPKPPSSPNLVNYLTQKGLVIGSPGSRTAPGELRDFGQQAMNTAHCIHRLNEDGGSFGRLGRFIYLFFVLTLISRDGCLAADTE